MIFAFACEIYKADIAILVEPSEKELKKFFENNLKKLTLDEEDAKDLREELEDKNNDGFVMSIKDKYLLCIKKKTDYILSHEIYHLANCILWDRGIPHTREDEPYAYLIGWLTEVINNNLK